MIIIHKVVADKKPRNCIECPLLGKRPCGKKRKVQTSSSGAYVDLIPDERCVIKPSGN